MRRPGSRWFAPGVALLGCAPVVAGLEASAGFDGFSSRPSEVWHEGLGWASVLLLVAGLTVMAAHLVSTVWTARRADRTEKTGGLLVAGCGLLGTSLVVMIVLTSSLLEANDLGTLGLFLAIAVVGEVTLVLGMMYVAAWLADAVWRRNTAPTSTP